jgi:hypothetical protein
VGPAAAAAMVVLLQTNYETSTGVGVHGAWSMDMEKYGSELICCPSFSLILMILVQNNAKKEDISYR